MNIALVDDIPREISRPSGIIEEYAAEHQLPVELKTFSSAEALLKSTARSSIPLSSWIYTWTA